MRIEQVRKAMMIAFLEKKALELVSGFGIGKTTMFRDFAKFLEGIEFTVPGPDGEPLTHRKGEPVGFEECLIPTYAVEDIRGFPMPDYDRGEMFYSVPPFFPSKRKYPNGIPKFGIIYLDEYRLGPDEVVKATTQLLLEGRMGDHSLAQFGHWCVFAASNREEDRVGIGKEPPIITQRKMVLNVEPNIRALTAWMEANEERLHVPATFRLFAGENPEVVLSMKTPDNGQPFCTPRSLVEAGQLCWRHMRLTGYQPSNKYDIPSKDDFLIELLASKIGESAAAQLQQFGSMIGLVPKYEEIIKNPNTAVLPATDRMDAAYVTITAIEHQAGDWSREADGSLDMERLEKEVDSLVTYLMRLPAEFQVTGLLRTFKKCPDIYSHPKVHTIAKTNPSVLKAISGRT